MTLAHIRSHTYVCFRDREGTEAATLFYFPVTIPLSTLHDRVNTTHRSRIAVLSDCAVCETRVEFDYFDPQDPGFLVATEAEAAYRGSFFFQTADDPDDRVVIDIPAMHDTLYISPDDLLIDTTNSDVADLVSLILANDGARVVNPFDVAPVSLTSAFKRVIPIISYRRSG